MVGSGHATPSSSSRSRTSSASGNASGAGYPDGLAREEIPLVARIVCCCDAFSAMTTDRPYRAARTEEAAPAELHATAGTQFDTGVVDALERIVAGHRAEA